MSSIDERIVQMQFQNSQFEKGVSESLKSLEKLKEGLKLEKAAEGLKRLQEAGDSFSLAKVSESVDDLGERFSVFGTFAGRIIENLADTVYNKLGNAIKSVTVGQIGAGWQKYAEDTEAVQTIMFATGKSIEEVEEQLRKLTFFTDETSYSYADMVGNIAKFTSNNIDLTDARVAMQGIATWAASAGQNAQTASRAMYNISQAMGTGAMKVVDWRSIELANMATTDFKKNAIEAAIALGTLDSAGRAMDKHHTQVTIENFRDSLQTGWFTKDVMMQVFGQYGDFAERVQELVDETGMDTSDAIAQLSGTTALFSENAFKAAQEAKTFKDAVEALRDATSTKWLNIFKLIFGNYEEAKVLWTKLANDLYKIFVEPLDTLVGTLRDWHKVVDDKGFQLNGTWNDFMQGVFDFMDGLKGLVITVRDALGNMIPGITITDLRHLAITVRDFGKSFKEAFGLPEDVKGVVDVVNGVGDAVKDVNNIVTGSATSATKDIKVLNTEAVKLQEELKKGSTGKEVRKMQEQLLGAGYSLDQFGADGIWGPETQAAWEAFCKDVGLDIDSVFDEAAAQSLADAFDLKKTQELFGELSGSLKIGDKSEEVKKLQERLIALGFSLDKYGADGIWGPETQKAYEEFLKTYNLDPAQEYDQKTHAIMVKALRDKYGVETVEDLVEKTKESTYATEKYGNKLDQIKMIFGGVAAASGIVLKIVGFIKDAIVKVWEATAPLRNAFMIAGAAIGEALINFNNWLGTSGTIEKWSKSVQKFLEPVAKWIEGAADSFLVFFGLKKPAVDSTKEVKTFSSVWKGLIEKIKKTAIFQNIATAFNSIKAALDKIRPSLKKTWDSFKKNFGKGLTTVLKVLGGALLAVLAPIGILIGLLGKLVGFVISNIPKGIEVLKNFWASLTFEGDESLGKAPGILAKAKKFVGRISDFLFGTETEDGKKKIGIFTRIGALLKGDMAGFTEGLSEEDTKKAIDFSEKIKGIYETIKSNIDKAFAVLSLLFTGNQENAVGLSSDVINRVNDVRTFLNKIGEAIQFLFTGEDSEKSLLSENTKNKINKFRSGVLSVIGTVRDAIVSVGEGIWFLFGGQLSDKKTISDSSLDAIQRFKDKLSEIFGLIYILFTGNKKDGAVDWKRWATENELGVLEFRNTILGYFEKVKGVFQTIGSAIRLLFTGSDDSSLISDEWKERIVWFRDKCISIFDSIRDNLAKTWPRIKLLFTGDDKNTTLDEKDAKSVLEFRDKIIRFFQNVGKTFKKIWAAISYLFTGKGADGVLSDETVRKLEKFRNGIKTLVANVRTSFSKMFGDLKGVFKNGVNFESIKNALIIIKDGIVSFFGTLGDTAKSILKWGLIVFSIYKVGSLIGNISGAFGKLKEVIGSYKRNTQAVSKSVLEFAAAIALIAGSIWLIGQLKDDQFKKGVGAVAGIIAAIGLFVALSGVLANKETSKIIQRIGAAIFDFAKAIGVLALTTVVLAYIPWNTFLDGLAKVGIMCLLMVHVIKKLNKFSSTNIKLSGLAGMAAAIGILALVVGLLARYKWETLGKGLLGLYGVVFILRGLMKTMGKYSSTKIKMKGLISLSIAVGLMALIVGRLGKMNDKELAKGLFALAAITVMLRTTIKSMSGVGAPNIGGLIAALASIGLVMAALVIALQYVKDIEPKTILAFSAGLSALLVAAGLFAKLSSGSTFGSVSAGALGLLEVIAVIGLVVAAFAGLNKIPGFQEFMVSGAETIGNILGTLVGAFSSSLIGQFGESVASISKLPEADPEGVDNAVACAQSLKTFAEGLPEKAILDKIVNTIFKSEFEQFSDEMGQFGTAFNNFATSLNAIESTEGLEEKAKLAVSISEAINTFAQTLPEKDNLTKIVNTIFKSEFEQFSDEMTQFGTAFNNFATSLNAIESTEGLEEKANLAVSISEAINTFAQTLPEKDNLTKIVNTIFKSEFEQFSDEMTQFGTAFNNFAKELNSIEEYEGLPKKAGTAIQIATAVNLFSRTLPKKDNWTKITDSIFGSEFETFSKDMKSFASAFNDFAGYMADVKSDSSIKTNTDSAIDIATKVAEFLNFLNSEGMNIQLDKTGIGKWLSVSDTVQGTVFDAIGTLAESIGNSKEHFENISASSMVKGVQAAIDVAKSVAGLLVYLQSDEVSGKVNFMYSPLDINELSWWFDPDSEGSLAYMLKKFGEQSSDISNIDNIAKIFEGIGNLASYLSNTDQIQTDFKSTGLDMVTHILEGFMDFDVTQLSLFVATLVSRLNDQVYLFEEAGTNFVGGLVNGIANSATIAYWAVEAVARNMITKVRSVFDEHSPSKVATQIGEYFTQGLANGVGNSESNALSATQSVAENMIDVAQGTLTSLSQLLAQGIDVDPVITPVVDLTNARASADAISSMFGKQDNAVHITRDLANRVSYDGTGELVKAPMQLTSESLSILKTDLDTISRSLEGMNNSDLVNGVNAMSDNFADLSEAVCNMKLVLDTGALVGGTSAAYDREFGLMTGRRERGN
jgi:peptidoglycan hydrolase-like protein with peptidoglycan-binding domain